MATILAHLSSTATASIVRDLIHYKAVNNNKNPQNWQKLYNLAHAVPHIYSLIVWKNKNQQVIWAKLMWCAIAVVLPFWQSM